MFRLKDHSMIGQKLLIKNEAFGKEELVSPHILGPNKNVLHFGKSSLLQIKMGGNNSKIINVKRTYMFKIRLIRLKVNTMKVTISKNPNRINKILITRKSKLKEISLNQTNNFKGQLPKIFNKPIQFKLNNRMLLAKMFNKKTTTTTNYQTQPSQQNQQSYSYSQSGNYQKPAAQVLEYNTYTRHVNQPGSQVPDFAGNKPQPPSQIQNQQVRGAPNVQSQQNSEQVDHFTYYPQEPEQGDFHRPGFTQQPVAQKQNYSQQSNFPQKQVKSPPPIVPPKPQINNQAKSTVNQKQFSQPANNQNYDQFYYKETTQENNGPPRVVSYSSQTPGDFSRFAEMQEKLPSGKLGNTFSQSHREYQDPSGQHVEYSYELTTSTDPAYDAELLKEQERRVTEQELEPGLISRNITTKYYKKKVVTDQDTNTF